MNRDLRKLVHEFLSQPLYVQWALISKVLEMNMIEVAAMDDFKVEGFRKVIELKRLHRLWDIILPSESNPFEEPMK